jgi:hypothetical protein
MTIHVNDDVISDEDLHKEMQYHPADSLVDAQNQASEALVIRTLLLQEAERQGFLEGSDIDEESETSAIDRLVDASISVPETDDESCLRYYEQNKQRFALVDRAGEFLPTESALPKIREYLQMRSWHEGLRSYVLVLASSAQIKGFAFS